MPTTAPPPIRHFRAVDERLLAGAQPTLSDYRTLAASGVTTVIDLRTGSPIDPRVDDAEYLRDLGIEHIALPLTDGHAPSGELLDRFFAAVDRAPGPVYVHCAAGVGRTTSLEMAYRSRLGMEHGVRQQLDRRPADDRADLVRCLAPQPRAHDSASCGEDDKPGARQPSPRHRRAPSNRRENA